MARELIKTDKNGTKYWNTLVACDRCGGDGVYKWGAMFFQGPGMPPRPQYAGVCFKCNGAGKVMEIVKEYTPEYRAKLDEANAKRKAKLAEEYEKRREAEAAEKAKRDAEIRAEKARREAERLAEIERNRGHFIGNVGDKFEAEVTLERTFSYEVPKFNAPWTTDRITGYVFKTDDNNTLVWKTTGALHDKEYTPKGHFQDNEKDGWYDYVHPEEGSRIKIRGTIKAHEEFNNVNQTLLNRVKWIR